MRLSTAWASLALFFLQVCSQIVEMVSCLLRTALASSQPKLGQRSCPLMTVSTQCDDFSRLENPQGQSPSHHIDFFWEQPSSMTDCPCWMLTLCLSSPQGHPGSCPGHRRHPSWVRSCGQAIGLRSHRWRWGWRPVPIRLLPLF